MILQSVTVVAYQQEDDLTTPIYLGNDPITSDHDTWIRIVLDLKSQIERIIKIHFFGEVSENWADGDNDKKPSKAKITKIWFHWYYPLTSDDIGGKINEKLKDLCDKFDNKFLVRFPTLVNSTRYPGKKKTPQLISILDSTPPEKKECHFKTLYLERP